jgi:ketosteroid isomerase-like protein
MTSFAENATNFNKALAKHDHAGIMAHLADDAILHQGMYFTR